MTDSNLRWATKDKNISNPSKYQSCNKFYKFSESLLSTRINNFMW